MAVLSFMGNLKGKSIVMVFDNYVTLKNKLGNRYFLSEKYYASSVKLNATIVRKSILEQVLYY